MNEPLMQVESEGQPAFQKDDTTENDNSAHSSGESKETDADQTQTSDGDQKPDAPKDGGADTSKLNNPPPERWVEREQDWKKRFNDQEVRHTSELAKLREDFEVKINTLAPKGAGSDVPAEIPSWFGSDDEAWKAYSSHTQQLIDKAVEKALSTIQQKGNEEQKAIEDATTWFKDQVTEIETDKELNPQSLKVDRNKILKFALDNYLIDEKGRWDYRKAFRFMKPQEVFQAKKDLIERKKIASATTSGDRTETKPSAFKTSQDFKNPAERPW